MLITALRNHQTTGYLYLVFLLVVLRIIPAYIFHETHEVLVLEPYVRKLFSLNFSFLESPIINLLVSGFLVLIQALLLNYILLRYSIFGKQTLIPAAIYIVVCSLFKSFLFIQPVLIVNFFTLLLAERIFALYKSSAPIARAFDLGLIIAAGTFIYFPFIALLPVIWIGVSIFVPFSGRVWLSGLLGFCVLYFFIGVYYFYYDRLDLFFNIFKPFDFSLKARLDIPIYDLFPLIPLAVAVLLSIKYYRLNISKNLVQVRKSIQVLLYLVLFSALGFYLQPFVLHYFGYGFYIAPRYTILHFLLWALPVSVYTAYYFIFAESKWLYESVFATMVGTIILFQLFLFGR